jgi:hypothetical protein
VRRHAKASTAGSTQRQAGALGRIVGLACLAALSLTILLLAAVPASAATVTDRPLLFSFNATDTPAGHFVKPGKIAVDDSSGYVYVAEGSQGSTWTLNEAISKFNPDGTAANFSALGSPTLFGSPPFFNSPGVAVDNSGGPNQSRLYVSTRFFGVGGTNRLIAYSPAGELLWQFDPGSEAHDVAVDSAGHPYLAFSGEIREYANTGSPPAQIASFPFGVGQDGGFDIDASGNVYVASNFSGVKKYVGGVLDSTLDTVPSPDVYVDQSTPTGHIFTTHDTPSASSFNEYDSSGALVATYGAGIGHSGRSESFGGGIAYRKSLDRVYVSDAGPEAVDAFGPAATGTVPDPTVEATTGIGVAKATLHGTVNPQSVPNSYYFEWSKSSYGKFSESSRSPLQSLPEDSSPHAISYEPTDLFGNSNYRVRLVTVNTANGLRQVSPTIDEFKTLTATAKPVVAINQPTTTTTTAHVTGTINPEEDSVSWGLFKSTDPACDEGFSGALGTFLPGGGVNTPVSVEADLKGLLPAQHYCVQIRAENSFGQVTSETREFSTAAIPPDEVSTAFAAPRTNTTARINGRVNPEGEADVTYHFELSEDGSNWTVLPERESSIDAREQVVVADELTGLQPNTTYYYRLASAENEAGPALSTGEAKTFTTRTTAEMVPPQRGMELVNNPDKGNQNVVGAFNFGVRGISPNGDRALWAVSGGAPGGISGTGNFFLARREPDGWRSRVLEPPAARQIGGGGLSYRLLAATPDFSHSIFDAREDLFFGEAFEATRVRLDDAQNQAVLQTYSWTKEHDGPGSLDMTDDGAHVLDVNHASRQLEEIGDGSGEVISIMPNGTQSSCGLAEGASFVGGEQEASNSRGAARQWRTDYHMIVTSDASLVYFEAKPNGECDKPWGLYVRDREAGETTLIDPGVGSGTNSEDVAFVTATPNGHLGYFATFSKLDPADTNEDADLYRWDEDSEESSCLTCVVPDASLDFESSTPGTYRPILISKDFSHVYFDSPNELVPGHPLRGSEQNLYVLSGGTVRFVAKDGTGSGLLYRTRSHLSEDGNTLLLQTGTKPYLTADAVGDKGIEEIYLYDDRDGSTECISCVHGGVTMLGVSSTSEVSVSDDGSTVAFATAEALVPSDVNRGTDVYEWRRGSRHLVTNGVTEFPTPEFAQPKVQAIDADGSNILFSVVDPGLTGFEGDSLSNLYVARIGGGFERPSPEVHCSEDSCQGPLQAAPAAGRPASSAFSGAGNQRSGSKPRRPCARKHGKAKQRCVRKHKRRAQKARANHNAGRTK